MFPAAPAYRPKRRRPASRSCADTLGQLLNKPAARTISRRSSAPVKPLCFVTVCGLFKGSLCCFCLVEKSDLTLFTSTDVQPLLELLCNSSLLIPPLSHPGGWYEISHFFINYSLKNTLLRFSKYLNWVFIKRNGSILSPFTLRTF